MRPLCPLFPALVVFWGLAACSRIPPELTAADIRAIEQPAPAVRSRAETLLPSALLAFDAAEVRALSGGRPLTADEMGDARALGVRHPERVRVLVTGQFPRSGNPDLNRLMPTHLAGGLTTGYGHLPAAPLRASAVDRGA